VPPPLSSQSGVTAQARVLVLAPDLEDSALWRRVAMLTAGGAALRVMGFRRRGGPLVGPAEVLGTTRNGAMVQRAGAVARAALPLLWRLWRAEADVILARNLEMLVLARLARLMVRGEPRLVYEVLDIHRLMLGRSLLSRTLRLLERRLAAPADLIVTSSPGFVREYFRPLARLTAPVLIVENRSFDGTKPGAAPAFAAAPLQMPPPGPPEGPLIIGWFGILRCTASLGCLDALTRAAPGRYRVVLRGRPARDVLADFDAVVATNPDVDFGGPYRNPEDLAAIYGGVHLVWAVDRYEAGGNSDWLLPNRLYEGCLHGAVPLALEGTETARFLTAHGIGVTIAGLEPVAVAGRLTRLQGGVLAALRAAVPGSDVSLWRATAADARALVAAIQVRPTTGDRAARALSVPAGGSET